MNKFLVLSVLLASQMSFAAPTRENRENKKEVIENKAGVARDAKMNETRADIVDSTRANADILFAEKLAKNDTRAEAQQSVKSLQGIVETAKQGDANAIKFLSEVRSEVKASNSGDTNAAVNKTVNKLGLERKAIDENCGG